ncbi:chitobiase/beta-hexosaminidase C-terminal domain-containing protein [Oligosphaera ethanolica]|uniref:GH29D-like beta-sandwich domain-containing protein n=1 Tax=Oligosphaera ethanolica TaxID=760260 RepID=A0AAE3VDW7_9BACT|nr:chitobiase/beta-hexosaminidase C-terminal domain-containing protein [Oligosphaera ethanolica]MDQ0288439.1 hypothetical protein [Oligosphaera ethanolica]
MNITAFFCSRSVFFLAFLAFSSLSRAGASASDVGRALDQPAGVTFSAAGGDWARKTGSVASVDLSGISTVNSDYLAAGAPDKANPRKESFFTASFQGSGFLSFRYKVSLDDLNWSELCLYDTDYVTGYLWSASGWWVKGEADLDENGKWDPLEDDEWWVDEEIYFNTDKYSRTITIALFGPTSVDYEKPVVDKEWDEVLYNKAWLDNFVWTPDVYNIFFQMNPSPGGTVTFADTLNVLCYSDYSNFVLYYTTDGSRPTSASPLYDPMKGIVISETAMVSVVIYENGQPINDTVYTGLYTKKAGTPQLNVVQQPYSGAAQLSFSSETVGAVFYYALGGAQPQVNADGTPGAGTFRGASYPLNGDTTISVMAVAPGAVNSEVVTRTFSKLAKPALTCLLDGHAYSEPPVFDQQATVTLAGPAGATIYYKLDDGAEQIYTAPLVLTASAYLTAQARREGMISSDTAMSRVIRAATQVIVPALASGGWQVFAVPGEISQSSSDAIIAARQPVAYDAQRRVYAKASRIRGGQAYWAFGVKPPISGIAMAPIEAIGGTIGKWQFTGAPSTGEFIVPNYFLAYRWDGQLRRFVKTDVIGAYGGLWLYIDGAGAR